MESVGFKEWAIVCEALGRGRQSIILRKGGIAEGRGGFSFRHRKFFLFPTCFHEQPEKVREIDIEFPVRSGGRIDINFFAKLELVKTITSWETAQALEPLHILKPEVVRERFEYDKKSYGGCRSWVKLPELPKELCFEPILPDSEHVLRRNEFTDLTKDAEAAAASR